ncbi:MAG TPA: hypothetical protein H9884_06960 [Candidatus Yaniella excrementigallinarum]|nr:hypothetical protein [Candidatus Yaniella excrementigallinarum]
MKHITFEGDLKGDLGSGAHDSSGIFAIQLGAKAHARLGLNALLHNRFLG